MGIIQFRGVGIGTADQQYRGFFAAVCRKMNDRLQSDTVTHRQHDNLNGTAGGAGGCRITDVVWSLSGF